MVKRWGGGGGGGGGGTLSHVSGLSYLLADYIKKIVLFSVIMVRTQGLFI